MSSPCVLRSSVLRRPAPLEQPQRLLLLLSLTLGGLSLPGQLSVVEGLDVRVRRVPAQLRLIPA